MKYKYNAFLGYKFRSYLTSDFIPLRLEHGIQLEGIVTLKDGYNATIITDLKYEVGQPVSIGGYETKQGELRAIELTITNFAKIEGAMITEKEIENDDN